MATAVQQKTLKKLFDSSMEQGGLQAFHQNWEDSIGVKTSERQYLDDEGAVATSRHEQFYEPTEDQFRDDHRAQHSENASGNWAIGEVFESLLGPRWKKTFEQKWQSASNMRFEGFGGAMMSGDTPYVSAALDVVAGLMNARALARAQDPEWIWDRVVDVQEAAGEGGFHIGSRLDPASFDGTGADLADGQAPPTSKDTQTRVHRNRSKRQARRVNVNYWKMRDDLTGQVMETVDQNGLILLTERERKVADALMGVASSATLASGTDIGKVGQAMPIVQDGLAWFPWQKGVYGTAAGSNIGYNVAASENGALIQNYGNCGDGDGLGLTNYTFLQTALQVLSSNLDPFTGLPTPVSMKGMQFLMTPATAIQLKILLQSEDLWQIAWGSAAPASISTATVSKAKIVAEMGLEILESQYWFNRLNTVGIYSQPATGAATQQKLTNNPGDNYATPGSIMSAYFMGHFKQALTYWQRMPYQTVQIPLGSVEMGEQTVLVQDHHERGQVFWHNPRLCWRSFA